METKFSFDENTYRHYMNGFLSVLHCHHYLTLTTKMAMDFDDLGGIRILKETTEDTIRPLFESYVEEHGLKDSNDILKMGAEYYSVMGLGKMKFDGDQPGKVVLERSHLDKGWVKKWEFADQNVNFFTCGYLSALFGVAFGKPSRSFSVEEKASIACGAPEGVFEVKQG